jgi:DNA-binding HxlR family transcriptional regulator
MVAASIERIVRAPLPIQRTQKSLTATLRKLERNGIIERTVLSTRPMAVEYRITPLGKTLRTPVDVLLAWATTHMDDIDRARDRFDAL